MVIVYVVIICTIQQMVKEVRRRYKVYEESNHKK